MGQSLDIPRVIPGNWKRLDLIVNKIKLKLGRQSSPTLTALTLTGLTASSLLQTDTNKKLISIALPLIVAKGGTGAATLTDHGILLGSGTSAITPLGVAGSGYIPIGSVGADPVLALITGTANQIISTPGAGSITLSTPQDIHTGASPTWVDTTWTGKLGGGSQASPIGVTNTRQYGLEFHYSGNDYSVTGIRSRAQLVTTDTTASAQGALLQAANNDGIDAGVLNGALIEAIGKSDATPATIAVMRGALVNAEWNDYDTVTNLKTLHVRTHSRNAAGAGSFGTGYGVYIENEAVGGNGQAYDAGIYFKGTNLSAGNKAFTYGLDFRGATYGTAEIILSNGETISNLTNDQIDLKGAATIGDGGTTNYSKFETDGTLEFNGAATVWKDINLGSALLTKPAASAPDTDEFKDEGGNDTGIETYAFAPGEKVSGNFELQHDYKEGSNITFHVHFQGIAASTGTDKVKWQLIYTVARGDATLDATTTIVKEIDFDTQYEFLKADFAVITGTNFLIEDQFLFQLSRITASADEYGGDALIATVGIHYEIDTVGSRAINTK